MVGSTKAGKDELTGTGVSNTTDESKKTSGKTWFEWTDVLLAPVIIAVVGLVFSAVQFEITNNRQDSDSKDKAIETREQVLTDYSKSIAELVTKYNLAKGSDRNVQQIASGETLIALRRLNVPDETSKEDKSKDDKNLVNWSRLQLHKLIFGDDKPDKSKDDAGKLKGLLIRYLFDAKLVGYSFSVDPPVETVVDLSTADITKVVLENAWLPGIGLQKAQLDEGNLKNTDLSRAMLYQASLRKADFTRANLLGANLTNADLTGATLLGADLTDADLTGVDLRSVNLRTAKSIPEKLKGACYVKGTEAEYFPPDFNPDKAGMVPMVKDESNSKEKDKYKPCHPS